MDTTSVPHSQPMMGANIQQPMMQRTMSGHMMSPQQPMAMGNMGMPQQSHIMMSGTPVGMPMMGEIIYLFILGSMIIDSFYIHLQ